MFQHRHYKVLAAAIMACTPLARDGKEAMAQWEDMRNAIAAVLQRDNPRFNRSRFIGACNGDYQNGKDRPR